MFFIGKTIKQIRKELNLHQIDLYSGVMSRSSYIKIEADTRAISIEELLKFSERLGINFFEILDRSGMNNKSLNETGKEKLLISKIFANPDLFHVNFKRIEPIRLNNLQYFSVYLGYISIAQHYNIELPNFQKTISSDLKKIYSNRTIYFGIDYEIIANLLYVLPYEKVACFIKLMYPITDSFGKDYDLTVQTVIKNALSISIMNRDLEEAQYYIKQFEHIKTIKNVSINGYFDLEISYLKQIYQFLTDKNIDAYMNAVNIINIFKLLGKEDIHRSLIEELTKISAKEKFTPPKEVTMYYENYVAIENNPIPEIKEVSKHLQSTYKITNHSSQTG